LRAYSIYCHGGTDWEIYYNPHGGYWDTATITDEDIANLWRTEYLEDYYTETYPDDCIALIVACTSFRNGQEYDMNTAWQVSNHLPDAFGGSTVDIDATYNDFYTDTFWDVLFDGGTIGEAFNELDGCDYTDWTYSGWPSNTIC